MAVQLRTLSLHFILWTSLKHLYQEDVSHMFKLAVGHGT